MTDEEADTPNDDSVSRRRYLGVQAAVAAGLLAGCNALDGGGGTDTDPSDSPTPTPGDGPTATRTDGGESDGDGSDGSESDGDESGGTTESDDEQSESLDGAGSEMNEPTVVSLDADDRGERPVPDTLFGRFAEHYGEHEIYPGIYAEHVRNVAFVDYMDARDGSSYVYDFETVGRYDGVPFPWHPIGDAAFSLPEAGGIRGYGTWDSDGSWPQSGLAEENASQRIDLDGGTAGVGQKLVLPDWRTLTYEFAVSARSASVDGAEVRLASPDGDVLASARIDGFSGGDWDRYEGVTLELAEQSGDKYDLEPFANLDESPYGEYVLEIVVEGSGTVEFDWVSLMAGDAVEGKYNPTTLDLMADRNTTWLKWPGGNVTSTYHWEDAVGPHAERPIRPNIVWDGIDPNYFGTAEYVELCELADLKPAITVGVTVPPAEGGNDFQPTEPITPEEAANWVEYCNGSTDTEYGALRAEHGYEEPFDVAVWEVGNEMWGGWQAGGTQDPETAAQYIADFAQAMREVDDSITVYADGMDPMYGDPNLPDPVEWNRTVVEVAGEHVDGLQHHRYSWGIRDQDAIAEWKDRTGGDGVDYSEVLVSFPTQFGDLLSETAALATEHGLDDPEIVVGEFGLFPTVAEGDPWPGMDTMAGAAYVAGMYNAFLRESDHLRHGCHTHLPVRMIPPDTNPLQPVGYTLKLYADAFRGDRTWKPVAASTEGPTRDLPETGDRIRAMADVPYVDAASMVAGDGALCAFLTNRNLRDSGEVRLAVPEEFDGRTATVTVQRPTRDPHAIQRSPGDYPDSWFEWTGLEVYETTDREVTVENGELALDLEPAAVARVLVE